MNGNQRHLSRRLFLQSAVPAGLAISLLGVEGSTVFARSSTHVQTHKAGNLDVTTQRIAVPAFFGLNNDWSRIEQASNKVGIVVPDQSFNTLQDDPTDPSFHPLTDAKAQFDRCRQQGQLVLGYVNSGSAQRDPGAINADINQWYTAYTDANGIHIDGIFFDEGPELDLKWQSGPEAGQYITDQEFQDFYKTLVHNFKTSHPSNNAVLLNGAAFPNEWVMQPVDSAGNLIDYVILWENSEDIYVNKYHAIGPQGILVPIPSWWTNPQYTQRIVHTVYATAASDLQNIVNLSQSRGAGMVYITDASQAVYSRLPTYWDQEVTLV